ncbi:MAG: arsenite methyltransferase, partial [Candidatus Omnitrophica bacterium]|nr:arsenite methyltransferase [Candidatus Omnitrophota bacterium]
KNGAVSEKIGYSRKDLGSIPDEANMGLGCGNPVALASLKEGETVIDLGCGGGIDVFLAARKVGSRGKVIGIDMTDEMLNKARANATKTGLNNVEFRSGEIENLPLASNSADCVISNCVINLSEDKQKVFGEAFRVLKSGGRLMVSDMVLLADLPEKILGSPELYAGCIAGALKKEEYLNKIKNAGFREVSVIKEDAVSLMDYIGSDKVVSSLVEDMPMAERENISRAVVSIKVSAKK